MAALARSAPLDARVAIAPAMAPTVTRLSVLSRLEALLRIRPSFSTPPFTDLPRGAPGRPEVAAAWAAGLLAGLDGRRSAFRPGAPASVRYLAILEGNALFPAQASAIGGREAVARAVALGLLRLGASGELTAAELAESLSRLRRDVLSRRPLAIALSAGAGSVGLNALDPLYAVAYGAGRRPVGLLAGERWIWHEAVPAGGRGSVGAAGLAQAAFLAVRPGRYAVWVALAGGVLTRPVVSARLAIRVFGIAAALAIHQSRPVVVADGRTVDMVRVEMVDRRGGEVLAGCPGATFALAVGPGAAIQDPATGRFDRRHLRLPCAFGGASFLVAALPDPTAPPDVVLVARAEGIAAAVTERHAVLHEVAARPVAVWLGLVPASVATGATVTWHVKVLDQAGNPVPVGTYRVFVQAVPALGIGARGPITYLAPVLPDGLALTVGVAPGAASGRWPVAVSVPGVGHAFAVLRVVPQRAADRLVARLLAPVVPLAAAEASTVSDPVDTLSLSVVDRQGVAVPYAGSLAVTVRLGEGPVPAGGLQATLSNTPGGGPIVLVYGGPGSEVRPGVYSVTVRALPGSPAVAPVTVEVQVVAPPAG